MTSYTQDPLWLRISAYQTDSPGDALPFSKKLSLQQGWTTEFTTRVLVEYKRFIYLCCILPNGASPSAIIDEVWHLHLTYTVDYWSRFCDDTLGRDIHHHPSRGGGDEAQKHRDWYADTLRHYREIFGAAPPADIWPATGEPMTLTMPKSTQTFSSEIIFLLVLPFVFIAFLYRQAMPFRLSGPHFLLFYPILAACWLGILAIFYYRLSRALGTALSPLRISDTYEGAYLAGGIQRVQLMLIADGVERGVLQPQSGGKYGVLPDTPGYAGYIGAPHIAMREVVYIDELKYAAECIAAPYEARYGGLRAAARLKWPSMLLGIILFATGIARMVQGIANGRPTGFLLLMIFGVIILCVALVRYNRFHPMCTRLLRGQANDAAAGITDNLARTVIFSGIAGLITMPAYYHLEPYFGRSRDGSGTDGGGGSSCGGSGCGGGGGCGGCGGCGGD